MTNETQLREALSRLLNSDPTGAIANATDDELRLAVDDEGAEPVVREQAAAILQARTALTATQKASPSHDILPEKHLAAMNALINFINNTGLNTEQAMCEAEGGFRTALREASSNGSDTVPVKRVLIHALSVALGNPEKLSALAGDTVEDSLVELAATKLVSQQERQWVGLTENDREAIRLNVGQEYCPYTAEAIEVKLREKNAGLLAADAQRPALKPLTDEQKRAMWHGAHSVHSSWSAYEWYAQGVEDSEAAHGIKEQA